jgi:hypothetical protein
VQESEYFAVVEIKIIEVGPANLALTEPFHLLMQASQDCSIDSLPKFGHRNISDDNIRHFLSGFTWIMCSKSVFGLFSIALLGSIALDNLQ